MALSQAQELLENAWQPSSAGPSGFNYNNAYGLAELSMLFSVILLCRVFALWDQNTLKSTAMINEVVESYGDRSCETPSLDS